MDILQQIAGQLQAGDEEQVAALTSQALTQGVGVREILNHGLIAGMAVVGEQFKRHEVFLPDVLLAARAMYAGMDQIKPRLLAERVPTLGKIVLGTVQGDLHDIGKNLVGLMLKGAGFDVLDLGNDVAPEKFVETAVAEDAPVIGMSALLTTTMPMMGRVVQLIRERGLEGKVRTIVGGAPVDARFAREIGADAYGFDCVNAVESVRRLAAR
ncbi:MAG TPA: corrinoid protein [Phycisphaerae bacterium]|nr:corrinoid protein [Phycisphaerae bacterium]HNU44500.1 corrinoid protein [Phycisphaerae bacterium]